MPSSLAAARAAPGGNVATLFWIVARLLFFLPALALIGTFFFASFWLACGILLGVGTVSIGWLGAIAAMLAFDCLPEGALRDGPFGLVRRPPRCLSPAGAAKRFARSPILGFEGIYVAISAAFALSLGAVVAGLFLF